MDEPNSSNLLQTAVTSGCGPLPDLDLILCDLDLIKMQVVMAKLLLVIYESPLINEDKERH